MAIAGMEKWLKNMKDVPNIEVNRGRRNVKLGKKLSVGNLACHDMSHHGIAIPNMEDTRHPQLQEGLTSVA